MVEIDFENKTSLVNITYELLLISLAQRSKPGAKHWCGFVGNTSTTSTCYICGYVGRDNYIYWIEHGYEYLKKYIIFT